jgi:hypothetical protein
MKCAKTLTWWTTGAAVAAMLASAAPSQAYRMIQNTNTGRVTTGPQVTCNDAGGFTHWNDANTNWYHNTANQGSGKAAALYNGMNGWTFVLNANHSLTYAGTTSAAFITDGVNVVSWGTGNGCSGTGGPGTCLALTALVLQSGQVISESDITFNNAVTWTTNGSNFDTWAVAAHEFGHTLGIHHTDLGSGPTMYEFYSSGWSSLEADDRSAIQCSQSRYPPTVSCIPDGGVDDTLSNTSCCSGIAVNGSTYCINPADYNNGWASCFHICGSVSTGSCAPSGGGDDTLSQTSCCSGAAVSGSTRCLNPADYNNGWATCIQTCQ